MGSSKAQKETVFLLQSPSHAVQVIWVKSSFHLSLAVGLLGHNLTFLSQLRLPDNGIKISTYSFVGTKGTGTQQMVILFLQSTFLPEEKSFLAHWC